MKDGEKVAIEAEKTAAKTALKEGADVAGSKTFKLSDIPDNINAGQQGKHIKGHNNFIEGRSYLNDDIDPNKLLSEIRDGKYTVVGYGQRGNPIVEIGRPIGVDGRTGQSTTRVQIHYGKNGTHVIPDIRK